MQYIAHRINTLEELKKLDRGFGAEIDIRDFGGRLILQHEPFKDGDNFEDFLKNYDHSTLILNIKSERIEHKVLELLDRYKIKDYFFLDSSFPMIFLLSQSGEHNIAIRFSEFEGLDTILAMKGKAKWVWVDCFSKLPINRDNYELMKRAGFKLCLVSPDLVGRPQDIPKFREYLSREHIILDAICAKIHHMDEWKGNQ